MRILIVVLFVALAGCSKFHPDGTPDHVPVLTPDEIGVLFEDGVADSKAYLKSASFCHERVSGKWTHGQAYRDCKQMVKRFIEKEVGNPFEGIFDESA